MKKLIKLLIFAAVAALSAILFAACSGANDGKYEYYLKDPGKPAIGNTYVDPNRNLNAKDGSVATEKSSDKQTQDDDEEILTLDECGDE
ncbi:MAG: hypothetical protein LBL66_04395 [Clostridiales bacterium]|jgi:hypothetical protein|nr:hypothetical protein [Clostridiales bacterium]